MLPARPPRLAPRPVRSTVVVLPLASVPGSRAPLSTTTKLLRLIGSWVIIGIGVPLLVRAQLGPAPFDVLNLGVQHQTGWSFGLCFVVNSLVFFALGAVLGAPPGWASILGTIVIGPMINLWLRLLPDRPELLIRVPMLLAGIAIVGIGICLVVTTEYGAGPTEVIMLGLVHRGMGIVPARWLSDGSPVVIGLLLGGTMGIGTVLFAVTMGPIVKLGLRWLHYEPARQRLEAAATGF